MFVLLKLTIPFLIFSLNDTVELPETLLNVYTFVLANNPANIRHGGVGHVYKNYFPVIVRDDLSFEEPIVVELNFGRKCFLLPFHVVPGVRF